jgi:putative ABC transport system permease protein
MSWIRRFINLFRRSRLDWELEEELASHIEEAIERGRSTDEARRAFGAILRHREASRDIKLLPWLDALVSDVVFGWRQLNKHRAASAAAILSLALAIGATTAAFRLVDALLLRPLPVKEPNHLYYFATTYFDDRVGRPDYREDSDYPTFLEYRQALAGKAELIVAGYASQQDVTFPGRDSIERPFREFVSGNFFDQLGIQPALGRRLTPNDDIKPAGHPVAVIGYDYWIRHFARDPATIGKTFLLAGTQYQIVGVAARGFTSTEPGVFTDIYLPAAMNVPALNSRGWSWFRILVRPKPGVTLEQIRQPIQALLSHDLEQRIKIWNPDTPKKAIANFLNQSILLRPAAGGASELKKDYRRPLIILGVLVLLVLAVACANVGNLLSVQAAARAREMALRISIGAGRHRLIQLVLIESLLLAGIAALAGVLFSWWSAPLVVSMLAPPEQPVRLVLDADWRVLSFGGSLTVVLAVLFGIAPALRASSIHPISALRGGPDLPARRGFMQSLVAMQVAFCVLVLFVAGLFVVTFDRLSNRPLGYSPQHVVAVHVGRPPTKQPAQIWRQVSGRLPGVESVAFAGWTLMSGNHWTVTVHISGRPEQGLSPYCLDVSPGFFETMRIGLIDGRDFRDDDQAPGTKGQAEPAPGVGIVNEAFARTYFDGRNPVGQTVTLREGQNALAPVEIVGLVRNAVYSTVRETIRPTIYVPVGSRNAGTLLLRTTGDPLALTAELRREIPRVSAGYSVSNVEAQSALVRRQMVREKLVATLSLFFAIVALILAAVGLYGVLTYSALLGRREIGIRMALGARPAHVVRRLTGNALVTVMAGIAAGIAGGFACGRFAESLLFGVKATDSKMIALPAITLLATAVAAAIPPVVRAVRLDPSQVLRE